MKIGAVTVRFGVPAQDDHAQGACVCEQHILCSEGAHVIESSDDGPLSSAGNVLDEHSVGSFAFASARKVKDPPLQGLNPVLPEHLQQHAANLVDSQSARIVGAVR